MKVNPNVSRAFSRILALLTCSPFSLFAALFAALLIAHLVGGPLAAQEDSNQEKDELRLTDFKPKPTLKTTVTKLDGARHPAIDIHTHFGFRLKGDVTALDKFVEVMDRNNIALCTSLDCKLGNIERHKDFLFKKYESRFLLFTFIDFQGDGDEADPKTWACNQTGFVRNVCEQLKDAKSKGICGVKFFKQFGLGYRGPDGKLLTIDDQRWDPIWKTCGTLQLPVIIHTGDPAAFFLPIDAENERYEELARHPEWSFHGKDFPSRQDLLDARNRVIERNPETQFIGAHMAGNPEDLKQVSSWLESYPNLHVEFASRIAELGRQPYSARDFIVKHQDRVLFGTDGPWPELRLNYYWRFMETRDENFPYSEKIPAPQGLWNIHGLGLPDDVLKRVYFENALKLIPSAKEKYQAAIDKPAK